MKENKLLWGLVIFNTVIALVFTILLIVALVFPDTESKDLREYIDKVVKSNEDYVNDVVKENQAYINRETDKLYDYVNKK